MWTVSEQSCIRKEQIQIANSDNVTRKCHKKPPTAVIYQSGLFTSIRVEKKLQKKQKFSTGQVNVTQ